MKNSTQVEIDSLEEEIEDNNQRLDEIHSLLKAFKNNVVGGEQISVDKKQYHLELEKEHREVEKQLYKLNKKLKSLVIERRNYWVGMKQIQKKYIIVLVICAVGYFFIAFVANNPG